MRLLSIFLITLPFSVADYIVRTAAVNNVNYDDFSLLCAEGIPLLMEDHRPRPCQPRPWRKEQKCPNGFWCHEGEEESSYYCCPKSRKFSNRCHLPPTTGHGTQLMRRFYYDWKTDGCHELHYTGIGGNENSFMTYDGCELTCRGAGEPPGVHIMPEDIPLPKTKKPNKIKNKSNEKPMITLTVSAPTTAPNVATIDIQAEISHMTTTAETVTTTTAVEEIVYDPNPCKLPRDSGKSGGVAVKMWYFDLSALTCVQFTYFGRGGNVNRFATPQECYQVCGIEKPTRRSCLLPPSSGDGPYEIERFYFDERAQKCIPFYYTGRGGNSNRFYKKHKCERLCLTKKKKKLNSIFVPSTTTTTTTTRTTSISTRLPYTTVFRSIWTTTSQPTTRAHVPDVRTSILPAQFYTRQTTTPTPRTTITPVQEIEIGTYPTLVYVPKEEDGSDSEYAPFQPVPMLPSIPVNPVQDRLFQQLMGSQMQQTPHPTTTGAPTIVETSHVGPVPDRFNPSGHFPFPESFTAAPPVPPLNIPTPHPQPNPNGLPSVIYVENTEQLNAVLSAEKLQPHGRPSQPQPPQSSIHSQYQGAQHGVTPSPLQGYTGRFVVEPSASIAEQGVSKSVTHMPPLVVTPTPVESNSPASQSYMIYPSTYVKPGVEKVPTYIKPNAAPHPPPGSVVYNWTGVPLSFSQLKMPDGQRGDMFGQTYHKPNEVFQSVQLPELSSKGALTNVASQNKNGYEAKISVTTLPTLTPSSPSNLTVTMVDSLLRSPCVRPIYEPNFVIMCDVNGITCPSGTFCQIGEGQSICCPVIDGNGCLQPTMPGVGPSRLFRWYFDPDSATCKPFIFAGFKGNQNNFRRYADCQGTCMGKPVCEHGEPEAPNNISETCSASNPCQPNFTCQIRAGYSYCCPDSTFTTASTEPSIPSRCSHLAHSGIGNQFLSRYFYSPLYRQCLHFIYTGVGGNENNFHTQHECLQYCTSGPTLTFRSMPTTTASTFEFSFNPTPLCPQGQPAVDARNNIMTCDVNRPCPGSHVCRNLGAESYCCPAPENFCLQQRPAISVCPEGGSPVPEIRFAYDPNADRCVRFTYQNCDTQPSLNSFESKPQCTKLCCNQGFDHLYKRKRLVLMNDHPVVV